MKFAKCIQKQLNEILLKIPVIIGIGNEMRGDDGAGIEIIKRLQKNGISNTLAVNSTPENYLQKIAMMPGNARLWIDIINWNGEPGETKIFDTDTISHYTISTHNFSLVVIINFLKDLKNVQDYFLGIQPQNLTLGDPISKPVAETVDVLVEYIITHTKIEE